ncbi:translation initiation factor IF-2 subunit alpha [Candidatus Woesearchaeota archaeon]|nr:translation initiation factor IF-2 subunit alpha [Candidatus Woesearchaeota archaeon]
MLFKKKGFPEESELVMCTVTKVQYHSVFVNLDEYEKDGMIHISEVSPGRIRNIRDFVKEGKKVVCLVLRVSEEKGHIDLSLRRVNEGQKRAKVEEIKKGQMVEKIIEFVAKSLNKEIKDLYKEVSDKILVKYDSLYSCFEEVAGSEGLLEKIGLEKKLANDLEEAVKQRVKEAVVKIEGRLKLVSYDPEGIEIIKATLKRAKDIGKDNFSVKYLGGGNYGVEIKAKDFKEAEKILKDTTEETLKFIENNKGKGEFIRSEA